MTWSSSRSRVSRRWRTTERKRRILSLRHGLQHKNDPAEHAAMNAKRLTPGLLARIAEPTREFMLHAPESTEKAIVAMDAAEIAELMRGAGAGAVVGGGARL